MMAAVDMVHVPYRGGAPALTDLIGSQVQVMFDSVPTSIQHIRAGRLRALAVTTATRSDVLPDLPTVGDVVAGYEASTWYDVGAPKNTPTEIVERLNAEINAGLAGPELNARFVEMGGMMLGGSPADFGRFIAAETEKWANMLNPDSADRRIAPKAIARLKAEGARRHPWQKSARSPSRSRRAIPSDGREEVKEARLTSPRRRTPWAAG
jgi:hypothetical protein